MITILISGLRTRAIPLLVTLVALMSLVACGTDDEAKSGLSVVATTSIWADVASQVVGDDGTVEFVIPIGADAHDYQVSPREVATMEEAELVISNGLSLELGLTDVLDAISADGANVLELGPDLDPIEFSGEGGHAHEDEEHEAEGHEQGDLDPHVWFDPERVAEAARLIAAELTALDPSVDWEARADEYASELSEADTEIVEILAAVGDDDRELVTNHDAFGYFADRYDFDVVGVVIPGGSTLADPSSAELAALVEVITETGARAIFAETTQPTRLAEAVAAEVGGDVQVVELYTGSLGEPDSDAGTLIEMLVTNAQRIADALS
ncbi:MAG: metal ABC transporter substrate-binding protein [Acidimicrobiia bacterium]